MGDRQKLMLQRLRDIAQGASNSAADVVAGPVDLIGAGLRYAGVPVPDDAVGSSKWMEQKGLKQQSKEYGPGLLGEILGAVGPAAVAGAPSKAIKIAEQMRRNIAAKPKLSKEAGAWLIENPKERQAMDDYVWENFTKGNEDSWANMVNKVTPEIADEKVSRFIIKSELDKIKGMNVGDSLRTDRLKSSTWDPELTSMDLHGAVSPTVGEIRFTIPKGTRAGGRVRGSGDMGDDQAEYLMKPGLRWKMMNKSADPNQPIFDMTVGE
jgi:hypothetical protein